MDRPLGAGQLIGAGLQRKAAHTVVQQDPGFAGDDPVAGVEAVDVGDDVSGFIDDAEVGGIWVPGGNRAEWPGSRGIDSSREPAGVRLVEETLQLNGGRPWIAQGPN